jgi:hypothetical protein
MLPTLAYSDVPHGVSVFMPYLCLQDGSRLLVPYTPVPAYIFTAAMFVLFVLAAVYLYRVSHVRRSQDEVEMQLLLEAAHALLERREETLKARADAKLARLQAAAAAEAAAVRADVGGGGDEGAAVDDADAVAQEVSPSKPKSDVRRRAGKK